MLQMQLKRAHLYQTLSVTYLEKKVNKKMELEPLCTAPPKNQEPPKEIKTRNTHLKALPKFSYITLSLTHYTPKKSPSLHT